MATTHAERLDAIRAELARILEERLAELTRAMRESEEVTRRIVAAEMEAARMRAVREDLDGQIGQMQGEVEALRAEADAIRSTYEGMRAERDGLQREVERMRKEIGAADEAVRRSREELARLEQEAAALQQENTELQYKLQTLQENVQRMKRLREELLSSISSLSKEMQNLSGSGE